MSWQRSRLCLPDGSLYSSGCRMRFARLPWRTCRELLLFWSLLVRFGRGAQHSVQRVDAFRAVLGESTRMIQLAGSISTSTTRLMAKVHGNKRHYQVLLDPERAGLLERLADQRGLRPAALMRTFVYAALKREAGAAAYKVAEAQDAATRRAGIANQVKGRCGFDTEQA